MILGLRVKPPSTGSAISGFGTDGLCDFEALEIYGVCKSSYSWSTCSPVRSCWTETSRNCRATPSQRCMPPEFIEGNLYQWTVELHLFGKRLPIAKDLAQRKVNSLVFEIRFPPSFPQSLPFFRILKPRFLSFIQVRFSCCLSHVYRSCAQGLEPYQTTIQPKLSVHPLRPVPGNALLFPQSTLQGHRCGHRKPRGFRRPHCKIL